MISSTSAFRADAKKRVNVICNCPDKVQKPVIAVADMVTNEICSAKVTDIIVIIIDVPVLDQFQFFVTRYKLFAGVTVNAL